MGERTQPITPTMVEDELRRLAHVLDEATEDLERRAERAGETEIDFKVAWAKAYRTAEGSIKDREAVATILSEDVAREAKQAEAQARVGRERLLTTRSQIDLLRTISASVRSQTS